MPIWDYKCPRCNSIKEIFIQSEEEIIKCRFCDTDMIKLLSSPAIHLDDSFPGEAMKKKK